jgi:hypothetical protein
MYGHATSSAFEPSGFQTLTTGTAAMARYFERRLRHLGIELVRTPFSALRANAISERWVKSVGAECLDHLFIFDETGLRRVVASYVSYLKHAQNTHPSMWLKGRDFPDRDAISRGVLSRPLGDGTCRWRLENGAAEDQGSSGKG